MAELFDGSTDDFRRFIPVNVNFLLEDALPKIEEVEMLVLPRFLGEAITEQIVGYFSESTLTKPQEKALFLARKVVANLGFERHLPFCEVQFDNDGVTVTASAERKPAFEYQTIKLSKTLLDTGWEAMDLLISHVASLPSLFPDWTDAPYYQEHQDALFKNAKDFSKFYPIQDRWLTFWALRPVIQAIEEDKGEAELARVDALPGTVTEDQKNKLIRKLKRAIAYQAVINALPILSFELSGSNVQLNYASQYSNIKYFQPLSKEQRADITDNLQKQADLFLSSYEQDMTGLQPAPETTSDSSPGFTYSTGAVTFA
jgi:hypothetical protein